jgi:hypothetical protein
MYGYGKEMRAYSQTLVYNKCLCAFDRVHACVHACLGGRVLCVHASMFMRACAYVCMYMCIHTHAHTYV